MPFLPADQSTMASQGVLKVPDLGAGSTDGLAIEGFFAPTGALQNGVLTSVDPRPLDPQVAVFVYRGYLGLDSGLPQSVYSLDQTQIDRGLLTQQGKANLAVGQSTTLPDGTVITFSGYQEFAALQLSHDPGQIWVLGRGDGGAARAARACCWSAGSGCSPGSRPAPTAGVPCCRSAR